MSMEEDWGFYDTPRDTNYNDSDMFFANQELAITRLRNDIESFKESTETDLATYLIGKGWWK